MSKYIVKVVHEFNSLQEAEEFADYTQELDGFKTILEEVEEQ